ncbi:hypothetical protein KY290_000510 [Solanum tuberosum]|uniref:Uncharacterized protein n=1 Tax=Solanum tuberosum TaxID=4113 RepID=A0ABQ7WJI9_SOLTU|nr:hypothetical protein KY289_000558 [Solanum tuberosum]KAH0780912.1 hypothetical protein KY290_000510 [Solanum tuberosum]
MSIPFPPSFDLSSKDETIITVQQLKMQFLGTRKGDLDTIESYVKSLKSIADSLSANDNPLSDSDLVLQLLAGLPSSQYSPYQNRISSQSPLPDFSGACSLLYMYESLLQEQNVNHTSEDENYSKKEMFDKIVGVFSTVSNVVATATDVLSMFGRTSTMASTAGNRKNTKRRNRGRGRR